MVGTLNTYFGCLNQLRIENWWGWMTNDVKSSGLEPGNVPIASDGRSNGWLKVGAIAVASAALGGLAAAWFYRKTLSQLQAAGNDIPDSVPESTGDGTGEDF